MAVVVLTLLNISRKVAASQSTFPRKLRRELKRHGKVCGKCGAATGEGAAPAPNDTGTVSVTRETNAAAAHGVMATNVAGALAYLAGFITGIIFLALDPYKSNSVVRFHAFQSIFFNVAWFALWIVWMVVSAILTRLTAGIFGRIALPLILVSSLLGFGLWAFLMYQAYQEKLFRLPIVGKFAAQRAGVKP